MNDLIRITLADESLIECTVEILITGESAPGATVIHTVSDNPNGSRLPEHIEAVATRLYHRDLSHLPPERIRWIERCEDPASSWESAFEITLTWVEAGMFEPAGYRRPHWTALSRRRRLPTANPRGETERASPNSAMA